MGSDVSCASSVCTCSTNLTASSSLQTCTAISPAGTAPLLLGDTCATPTDCAHLFNATCSVSNKCDCFVGSTPSHDKLRCYIPPSRIGQACVQDDQCPGAHSACVANLCACDSVYFAANGDGSDCVLSMLHVGDTCQSSQQCPGESTCFNSTCSCQASTAPTASEPKEDCLLLVPLVGQPCLTLSSDCAGMATCQLDSSVGALTCQCPKGFEVDASLADCMPLLRLLGEPCYAHVQCADNAGPGYCNAVGSFVGVCVCESGFKASPTRERCVVEPKGINQACFVTKQCVAATARALCDASSSTCRCPPRFRYDDSSRSCELDMKKVGDTCDSTWDSRSGAYLSATETAMLLAGQSSSQCLGLNTVCSSSSGQGTCVCQHAYVSTANAAKTDCVATLRKLWEVCELDWDCVPGAVCDPLYLRCVCPSGYASAANNASCSFDPKTLDQACVVSAQCNGTANSFCSPCTTTCQCKVGYARQGAACIVDKRNVGQHCDVAIQCPTGAVCNGYSVCTCDTASGYEVDATGRACSKRQLFVFDSCTAMPSGCPLNAYCDVLADECLCSDNYVPTDSRDQCTLHKAALYETCDDAIAHCAAENSECTYRDVLPLSPSTRVSAGSHQYNNVRRVCVCRRGYRKEGASCVLDKKDSFSKPCFIADQCPGSNAYCDHTTPSSAATWGVCRCLPGFRYASGLFCVSETAFVWAGEKCDATTVCPDHSACVAGVCQCDAGYAFCGAQCGLTSTLVYDKCSIDLQCPNNAACSSALCGCTTDMQVYLDRQTCVSPSSASWAIHDGDCTSGATCANDLSCNSVTKKCECDASTKEATPDGMTCLPKSRLLYDTCPGGQNSFATSWQCPFRGLVTDCTNGACACKTYYNAASSNATCSLDAKMVNDTCQVDMQCLGGSTCPSGVCTCVSGKATRNREACVTDWRRLTETCVIGSTRCQGSSLTTACKLNGTTATCQCLSPDLKPNADKTDCVVDTKRVNEACLSSLQCPANGVCNSTKLCQCNPGYSPINDGLVCSLLSRKINETCDVQQQCGTLAVCSSKKCICTAGYRVMADAASCELDLKPINASFIILQQCGDNTDASASKCTCLPGYVPKAGLIGCQLNLRQIGQSCQVAVQCGVGAACNGTKVCECGKGYTPSSTLYGCVVIKRAIEQTCYFSEQCPTPSTTTFAYCDSAVWGRCKCYYDDYRPLVDLMAGCEPDPRALDEKCISDRQCSWKTTASHCDSGCTRRCVCDAGYVALNGACVVDKRNIRQSCTLSTQCPQHSTCSLVASALECTCNAGYTANPGATECTLAARKLNEQCGHIDQCPANAECIVVPNPTFGSSSRMCRCKAGYSMDGPSSCTLRTTSLFSACEANAECTNSDPNTYCENGFLTLQRSVCLCSPGYFPSSGKCVLDKKTSFDDLSGCLVAAQCPDAANAECSSNLCQCTCGYKLNADRAHCDVDSKALNGTCCKDVQCPTNSECRGTVCSCKSGYSARGAICDVTPIDAPCTPNVTLCGPNQACRAVAAGQATCGCTGNYVLIDGQCKANLDTPCTVTAECSHINGAECMSTAVVPVCKCSKDYSPNLNTDTTKLGSCNKNAAGPLLAAWSSIVLLLAALLVL